MYMSLLGEFLVEISQGLGGVSIKAAHGLHLGNSNDHPPETHPLQWMDEIHFAPKKPWKNVSPENGNSIMVSHDFNLVQDCVHAPHLSNPGRLFPLKMAKQTMVSHDFNLVQDCVHQQ